MPDKLSLLIIEDNAAERALIDAALDDFPAVDRRMATSLAEAQREIDARAPDVALLDLELPDARGLEGVGWLQRRNPQLPIVVLSGFGADDLLVASEAVGLGAQDFLCKSRLGGSELMRTLQLAKMRKRREIHSLSTALRDPLTGLPGVALLEERYLDSVARSRRNNCGLALLHIDVDGFAAHQAAVGADFAEAQLIEISSRLGRDMRRTDVMARLDGAAFLTLVDAMKHVSDAYVVARRLIASMRQPFPDVASGVALRLSIGVALRESEDDDFDRHRDRAEDAMYEARRQGGDRYAPAERLAIAAE